MTMNPPVGGHGTPDTQTEALIAANNFVEHHEHHRRSVR
jgi:hypothetical protein